MNLATCQSGVELLMEYLEGELPADVKAALDAHVSGCERCLAFVASYRATPELLRAATAATLPADLQESLLKALRERRRS